MRIVSGIWLVWLCATSWASSEIELHIRSINPRLPKAQVVSAAKAIEKACNLFTFDCKTFTALLGVESHFKVGAVNRASNDYGIAQINQWNIDRHGLNKKRLLTDVNYSVYWGAHVFHWFWINYPEFEAVGRYNCGTLRSCVTWKHVKRYIRKVKEYRKRGGYNNEKSGGIVNPINSINNFSRNLGTMRCSGCF